MTKRRAERATVEGRATYRVLSRDSLAARTRLLQRCLSGIAESAFVLPLVILVGGTMLVPAGIAMFRSVFAWDPGYPSPFVGLENFVAVAESPVFQAALKNEAFLLLGVPLWTALPLALALLLYERVPFAGAFRTIYFFPAIVSPAILAILFRGILAPEGLVNSVLDSAGMRSLSRNWLTDPALVKPILIVILAWAGLGTGVVIFSAALSAVPPELFEAAEMDGASSWQRLWHVMLPGIHNVVMMWIVFQVIGVFLFIFPWIFVLTGGGPGFASVTLDYEIWQRSFSYGEFGLAAAESAYLTLIVAVILVLAVIVHRRTDRDAKMPYPPARGVRVARAIADGTVTPLRVIGRALRALLRSFRLRAPSFLRRGRGEASIGRTAVAVLTCVPFVYPFFLLAGTALRTTDEFTRDRVGLPGTITLDHLESAWTNAGLGRAMLNSVIAVGVGVCVTSVISTTAAFWFLRRRGRLPRITFGILVGSWVVPYVIFVIPFFVLMSQFRLTDNLVVLGLVYGAINAPFGLFFIYSYLKDGVPNEVLEAAQVDGASVLQQFVRIVLPLSTPALGTLIALAFVWTWGDLLIAVILLQDPSKFTATVAAAGLASRFDPAEQENAAAALITMLPLLLVFILAQRAIVRGFTAGLGK